jgi:hypothetical protein
VQALRQTAGPFFIAAGALQFVIPQVYRRITREMAR